MPDRFLSTHQLPRFNPFLTPGHGSHRPETAGHVWTIRCCTGLRTLPPERSRLSRSPCLRFGGWQKWQKGGPTTRGEELISSSGERCRHAAAGTGSASAVLQAAGASITLLLKGQRWGLWEADTGLLPQPRGWDRLHTGCLATPRPPCRPRSRPAGPTGAAHNRLAVIVHGAVLNCLAAPRPLTCLPSPPSHDCAS